MFTEMTLPIEVAATKEYIEGLRSAIEWNVEQFKTAEKEEDKRIYEAKLKDLGKALNEAKSCKDHQSMSDDMRLEIDKLQLEIEKLEYQKKNDKKQRWFDGIKTGATLAFGFIGTIIGVKASRENMKVLANYEQEHYVATAAEKEAIRQSCDVLGTVRKFESKIGLK